MSTATADSPAQTYSTILAEARIAALRALTDILNTSEDPVERRHAATTILRLPEPEPAPPPKPVPTHTTYDRSLSTGAPSHNPAPQSNTSIPDPPQALENALNELQRFINTHPLAGLPDLDLNDDLDLDLDEPVASPAAIIAAAAGTCPPS